MILRWVCQKCDMKSIYPIEECVQCGGELKRVVGEKIKVIGFSKVSIPSVSHPIVPYYALILEDENGHRMPKKTMKEYNVGDKYEVKPTDDKHGVSIIKIKYDVGFAVEKSLSLIPKKEIDKNTKILVKPSVMTGAYSYLGMTTNPDVLEAVLSYLIKEGAEPNNIVVAETVQFGDFEKSMKKAGIESICKKFNVELKDISQNKFVEKKSGEFTFKISKLIFENDLIVNVPVMKTHMMLGISGALENMTRIIHQDNVKELMSKDINLAMFRLHEVLPKNQIIIGDCTIGLQGNGPLMYGEPAFLNRILASNDPVSIDKVYQEMCLLRNSPHVEKCGEEGIGENDLMHITIVGDELDACRLEIKQPIGSKLIKMSM